jgi:hypothetical protein
VPGVLVEVVLELERLATLGGVLRIERPLRKAPLQRSMIRVESTIRSPSRSSTGRVPSPRENAIALGAPGINE